MNPGARRHDLDWLRVFAFALLIFYHIGMFFVSWDWHVKSAHAGPAIEPLMTLVNPWRLALLFIISGVAIRFASDKLGTGRFVWNRLVRLALPLVFGVVFIVAPQSYFELRQDGVIESGFWAFWLDYLDLEQRFSIITPTWNHLWYVAYLLCYCLVLAPFLPWLGGTRLIRGLQMAVSGWGTGWIFVIPTVPFVVYGLVLDPLFPTTHALVDDWANHAHRFTALMLGYVVAKAPLFWRTVDRFRWMAWIGTAVLAIGLTSLRLSPMTREWIDDHPFWLGALHVSMVGYAWLSIISLFAVAQRYFFRPSSALTYLNEAVYPYYILHQTLIVSAAYWLSRMNLSVWGELAGILLATLGGCMLLYEWVIRRSRWLRPLFGLRPRPPAFNG